MAARRRLYHVNSNLQQAIDALLYCCNQEAQPSPNRYMAFRPCVVQFAQFSLLFLHTACRLRAGRPAWFVARTFTCPRSAMRRIVFSSTETATNESNHGRLVVTPTTRLGEVQP